MLIINTETQAYPVSEFDIRQANPDKILPAQLTAENLPEPFALVSPAERPPITRWQAIRELPPIAQTGQWHQRFEAYNLPLSLAEKQAEIKRDADRIARHKRDSIMQDVSAYEAASWPIKRAEAIAYNVSGSAADAPNLSIEAGDRGVPLADLVGKVLGKSTQLAALEAAIAGRCGAIQDAATAAKTEAALLAIELESGWPV